MSFSNSQNNKKVDMGIWISGYLPDDNEDSFIKYDQYIDAKFNSSVLKILGHDSLEEFSSGMWPLSEDQALESQNSLKKHCPLSSIFLSAW